MRLHYLKKREGRTIETWPAWKDDKDCSPFELEQANLRYLKNDEVVLDIDEPEKLKNIIRALVKLGYTFQVWKTGSKGYHINILFGEVGILVDSKKKLIREWFAIHYCTCLSKKTGMLALENRPHFKTGILKEIITDHKASYNNVLPLMALEYLKEKDQPQQTISHDNNTPVIKACKLMDYCLNIKLKENTGRGEILFRNSAIFFNNNYKKDEPLRLMEKLATIQKTGDTNWLEWARTNNKKHFSCGELRSWLRISNQENVEQLTCWRCNWQNKGEHKV